MSIERRSLTTLGVATAAAAGLGILLYVARRGRAPARAVAPLLRADDAAGLCARVYATDDAARAAGELLWADVRVELVPSTAFGDRPFRVTHIPTASKAKPACAASAWPADGLAAEAREGSARAAALLACGAGGAPTHAVLLNKWPLLRAHVVLARVDFLPQWLPLDAADAHAAWAALRALGGLAFFNCGTQSGASQPRRHVQAIPGTALRAGGGLPLDAAVAAAAAAAPPPRRGAPFTLGLGFGALPHAAALLDAGAPLEEGAAALAAAYEALLEAVWPGSARARAAAAAGPSAPAFDASAPPPSCPWPHNFIVTPSYCVLVPRTAAEVHGADMNSLAFAGLLLSRGGSLAAALKGAGSADPLTLLRAVAGTAAGAK
jgi:ATP adenylyltransferase